MVGKVAELVAAKRAELVEMVTKEPLLFDGTAIDPQALAESLVDRILERLSYAGVLRLVADAEEERRRLLDVAAHPATPMTSPIPSTPS